MNGRISIKAGRLFFHSESLSLSFPLAKLEIEPVEGASDICFLDSIEPGWRICTADQSIAGHPELRRVPNVRNQLGALLGGRELRSRMLITLGVAGFCVLLAWLGSVTVSLMVDAVVARVPVSTEKKWGDEALEEWGERHKFLTDSNQLARLAALAKPLLAVAAPGDTNFDFHITDYKIPNAFALPGGHVVVTTGLLDLTERPEELLGVLAHELVHVTHRHILRKQVSAAGPMIIFGVFAGRGGGVSDVFTTGSALLVAQGFSQEYETEADLGGWDYLVAANIDPRGMIDVFHKLEDYQAKYHMEAEFSEALSDHPATEKRIARLQKKWDNLPVKTGFIDFGNPKDVMP